MAEDGYIAALKRERAAYEQAGKTDRAKQVTAELERVGAEDDDAPEAVAASAAPVKAAREPRQTRD